MDILALDIGGSKLMAAPASISRSRIDIGHVAHRSLGERYTTEKLLELDATFSAVRLMTFEKRRFSKYCWAGKNLRFRTSITTNGQLV